MAIRRHVVSRYHTNVFAFIISTIDYACLIPAAYNPYQPYHTEVFDPAEADPDGYITRAGDSYPLNLPVET